MINRFVYVNVGLAAVLVFVGAKMLVSNVHHLPVWASLRATRAPEEEPLDAMSR